MSNNPRVSFLERLLGANYKTTLTGAGANLMWFLTLLSGIPYDSSFQALSTFLPPVWKTRVTVGAAFAAFLLGVINSHFQKSKSVTGGSTIQGLNNETVDKIPK